MSKSQVPSAEFAPDLAAGGVDAAVTAAGASRMGGVYVVPPQNIRKIEGFNVRIKNDAYHARVEWICNSIIQNGYDVAEPLKVFVSKEDGDSHFDLVDGEHRLDAVMLAIERGHAIEKVPVIIAPKGTSMDDLTFSLITSNSGKPLEPYETAIVIKRLIRRGVEMTEIERRTGYNKRWLDELLTLAAAPKPVLDMVAAGKISSTLAIAELKDGTPNEVTERLKNAVTTAESQGKDRATAKHISKPKKARKPKEITPIIVDRNTALQWVDESGFMTQLEADKFVMLVARVAKECFDRGGYVEIDAQEAL